MLGWNDNEKACRQNIHRLSHITVILEERRMHRIYEVYSKICKDTPQTGSAKIAAGAVVCVESEIRGDVTIGARTVVHPKARIIAEAGPIIIGEGNLIEEQALIINSYPENIMPDTEGVEPKTMTVGTNNVFEVGCVSQALKIGDNNVIESKADLGRNVILTSGCIIGACCQVNTCEVVPENTVVYGSNCIRRVQSEKPQPQTLQLDFLMKILPNYHHLKKTVKGNSTPVRN
ncbi:dynactin subunit 6-like isoform X1 [Sebastes umbrosus]|uniref:dynactin subunit 6-like isoform X1 n=1 Tax=Sebastes umbrosus TaxID=72105 RepID=UPI00189EA96D|nr:dynactin subunit 6-like isoform X1 [Sebastes umbrosus]